MNSSIDIAEEVAQALSRGRGVVALESTIIAHGMPWPQNIDTAKRLESIIREEGCVPATIAVLNGRIKVGLDIAELEFLARSQGIMKLSSRDLPLALLQCKSGATTVAATMQIAEMAGIHFFVTGGIGGVHRDVADNWDVSADLMELSRRRVAVVCAGAKSILDIGKTVEALESLAVPVLGYQTDWFPSFYNGLSQSPVMANMDNASSLADFVSLHLRLENKSAVLIVNPIPQEDALDGAEMDAVIQRALSAAKVQGVQGKALTPFLLAYVSKGTKEESLKANIALVLNNARLGAQVARLFSESQKSDQ